MYWKKISKGRIQKECSGFSIIKPENGNKPIPLFCPICANVMRNLQDAEYYRKWEACYECGTVYAEPNRNKWLSGWRPDLLDDRE